MSSGKHQSIKSCLYSIIKGYIKSSKRMVQRSSHRLVFANMFFMYLCIWRLYVSPLLWTSPHMPLVILLFCSFFSLKCLSAPKILFWFIPNDIFFKQNCIQKQLTHVLSPTNLRTEPKFSYLTHYFQASPKVDTSSWSTVAVMAYINQLLKHSVF